MIIYSLISLYVKLLLSSYLTYNNLLLLRDMLLTLTLLAICEEILLAKTNILPLVIGLI